MKKPFVALLLLMGAAAMLATSAFAQSDDVGLKLQNAKMAKELMRSRASNLGVSAGADPDSVYVGKSYTNHTGPGNTGNLRRRLPAGNEHRDERVLGLGQLSRYPGRGLAARLVALAPPVQLDRRSDSDRRSAYVVGD